MSTSAHGSQLDDQPEVFARLTQLLNSLHASSCLKEYHNILRASRSCLRGGKPKPCDIPVSLSTMDPEVFFLCSLNITPTSLGTLKSVNYLAFVLKWWREVDVPHGLAKAFDNHSDIVPKVFPTNRQVQHPTTADDILSFVQRTYSGMSVQMALPYSGNPLPFVRIGQVKLELSYELANAFVEQQKSRGN